MTPFTEPVMWFYSLAELPRRAAEGETFFVGSLGMRGWSTVMWRKGRYRKIVSARPL